MREVSKDLAFLSKQHAADLGLAHLRWGHRSFRRCADILGIPAPAKVPFCVACVEAKATRHGRRSRVERESPVREPASRPGFRLFFDPVGPFREPTLHRFRYALVVLDDFSGLVHTKLMARLSDWFGMLAGLVKRIEAEKGSERVVAQIGSDSFPAFVEGRNMLEFAASRGILLIASPPYTQKLNPVEGIIKILIRMALAMLRHAGAPKSLIEYSMSHATLLLNRLPRQKKGSGLVVALNLWLGLEPPSILHKLKVWGCAAYALVMGNRSKFDSKVTRQVHLGYDVARSAYILCSLPHFKISYSAHVTFNEDDFPMRGQFKPDPEPFRLLEETPGPLLKHHTSGEVWTYGSSGERVVSADVGGHVPPGTLDPGAGLVRVHGHSGVGENSQPLERGRESRPTGTFGKGWVRTATLGGGPDKYTFGKGSIGWCTPFGSRGGAYILGRGWWRHWDPQICERLATIGRMPRKYRSHVQ